MVQSFYIHPLIIVSRDLYGNLLLICIPVKCLIVSFQSHHCNVQLIKFLYVLSMETRV